MTADVRKLASPAVRMGAGLLVLGGSGYAFVALSGHTLSTGDAAAISAFYLLANIVGPGVFAALEQETSRSVSATLAVGGAVAPVARRSAIHGGGLLGAAVVVLAAIAPVLVPSAFGGRWGLFAALILASCTSAAVYLARGVLSGQRRFPRYAATMVTEGLTRLVPCLVLAVSGGADATRYALLFAAGSAFGALAGLPWTRRRSAAAAPAMGAFGRRLWLLVGSTVLAQLVANLAPVVVAAKLAGDTAWAAAFASAFVLVRVPVTLFAPVQAMLLPALTQAAIRGEHERFRRRLRLVVLVASAVGALGMLLALTVGGWAVQVLFGARVRLSWEVVGALGGGTLLLVLAQVFQPALVALGRHRVVTMSWLAGAVTLAALLALPGDPLHAAAVAQLAGSGVVAAGMWVCLRQVRNRRADQVEDSTGAHLPGGLR